jgi:hypothetical protein
MLHDPKLSIQASFLERRRDPFDVAENSRLVLCFEPKHYNAYVLIRWIAADIAEIEIEGD